MGRLKKNKLSEISSFDLQPGRILTRKYEVISRLGAGWEGEVFLVNELSTGIERAIKLFYPQRNPGDRTAGFYARKLHKLRHCPMVIQYHNHETVIYKKIPVTLLVSDYIEGILLSDFIVKQPGKRLMPFQALHLLHTLASGIECIHAMKEYHGDLHTENIIIQRYGLGFDLKLLDFYHWGTPKPENIREDVIDLVRILYDAVGGQKYYAKQPPRDQGYLQGAKAITYPEKLSYCRSIAGIPGNTRMALDDKIEGLYAGVECSKLIQRSFAAGTICLYTAKQPGKLTVNEDTLGFYQCDDCTGVLVVADGLGGLPEGDKASTMVTREILSAVSTGCTSGLPTRESILDGIERANRKILDRFNGAATTIIAMEITGKAIRSYHVGDSQALVSGQKGKIKYQTIAHSPVGYAVEAGLLQEEEALSHEDRHIISNMVGSHEMRLEIGPLLTMAKRDTMVLGSDGLFDNMTTEEIIDIIRCGKIEKSAEQLVSICHQRMSTYAEGILHKPDDLSFILYRPD